MEISLEEMVDREGKKMETVKCPTWYEICQMEQQANMAYADYNKHMKLFRESGDEKLGSLAEVYLRKSKALNAELAKMLLARKLM